LCIDPRSQDRRSLSRYSAASGYAGRPGGGGNARRAPWHALAGVLTAVSRRPHDRDVPGKSGHRSWPAFGALCYGLALSALAVLPLGAEAEPPVVVVARLDGIVNPVATEYIAEAIARGEKIGAAAVILELDTPGGLYKSTRIICKSILASGVPFVTYVAPAGSRATSAGVFITYASHVAAMHPTSSLGAATPVSLGAPMDSTMAHKAESDAEAFIRSLAERNGRNANWAEMAVRRAVSVTADTALALHVIDLVAPDLPALLQALDGRKAKLESGTVTLHTAGARVEELQMGFRLRVLDYVSDPNISYVLFTLGTLGLILELYNPGSILPGVAGVISIILAFYGMHTLPMNGAGLLLILTAIVLFILEIKITSHGILAIGGVVAMLIGSLMLFDFGPPTPVHGDLPGLRLSVILPTVAVTALFFLFVVAKGAMAQRRRPVTGLPGLMDCEGTARMPIGPGRPGTVNVQGEIWQAESVETIAAGEAVRVIGGSGLKLKVRRATAPGAAGMPPI
jgi:membrane-bound serine protease (ClpP class)